MLRLGPWLLREPRVTNMPIIRDVSKNDVTGSIQQLSRQRAERLGKASKPRSLAATLRALGAVGTPAKLPDELLDRAAAAKLLRISPRSLDRWHVLRSGPPRVEMVGLIRYYLGSIVQWLQDNEVHGPRSSPTASPKHR